MDTSNYCYTYTDYSRNSKNSSATNMRNCSILNKYHFKHYIDQFNDLDEMYGQNMEESTFSNAKSWDFLSPNIPFFDCPDKVS